MHVDWVHAPYAPGVIDREYKVIVIGGGHAGAEAAWAAANLLPAAEHGAGAVGLVTLRADTVGVMSCNPAIGGLAKGQLVREIDALGGLMGLAADATGINFKMLNVSRGPAVRGPRAQCDKHAYARAVQSLVRSREEIETIDGRVERLLVEDGRVVGVEVESGGVVRVLAAPSVVLTTGTFMRGLMHEGERRTPGGRHGEAAASRISESLRGLGFELGRLKTGTCPRLKRSTIDWDGLPAQWGDEPPTPFSDLTAPDGAGGAFQWRAGALVMDRFPLLEQVDCRQSATNERIHDVIRANLHRAPMFTGQIEGAGPRYCPSIEDKVVRFAERTGHGVFLEPESHEDECVYCNGISTSLPRDVQDEIVRLMPGCERAGIVRYGYAVEYDFVPTRQTRRTLEAKRVAGLYLAGQINGTSGYEEAAAQGLVAGVNAVRWARGEGEWVLGREEAYIGVLMDDLVTRTPVEPYRMFTSRAEHRLLLRADNSADRLTPVASRLGLLEASELGTRRMSLFDRRVREKRELNAAIEGTRIDGVPVSTLIRRPEFDVDALRRAVGDRVGALSPGVWASVHADRRYEAYVARQQAEIKRQRELERRRIPVGIDFERLGALRAEARQALARFRPATFGQAARLEGVTPADLTLLGVLVKRAGFANAG